MAVSRAAWMWLAPPPPPITPLHCPFPLGFRGQEETVVVFPDRLELVQFRRRAVELVEPSGGAGMAEPVDGEAGRVATARKLLPKPKLANSTGHQKASLYEEGGEVPDVFLEGSPANAFGAVDDEEDVQVRGARVHGLPKQRLSEKRWTQRFLVLSDC